MYSLFHPGFIPEQWHVFVSYVIVTWLSSSIVLFWNRSLPVINDIGLFLIVAGVTITIITCAVMPGLSGGSGYATHASVWTEWSNETGYTSEGFVFCMGMLNGAFAVGTPGKFNLLNSNIQGCTSNQLCRLCYAPRRGDSKVREHFNLHYTTMLMIAVAPESTSLKRLLPSA